jgi:hypothetical protein
MPSRIRIAVGLLIVASLAGCDGGRSSTTDAASATSTTTAPRRVTLADAKRCPVTKPSRVGPRGVSPRVFWGWDASHGNGKLWVGGLWPDGVIAAEPGFVDAQGSVNMKFGWWRAVPGQLRITSRRLDAPAPPSRPRVPEGYGEIGFQSSGVVFSTEGCWEITGTVDTTSLTFVTFVIKRGL